MTKAEIRRLIREQKARLTDADRLHQARAVFAAIEQTAAFRLADRVLLYASLPDELPTDEPLQRWSASKQLFLPRVNGSGLDILPYEPTALAAGSFSIPEPTGNNLVDPRSLDLIIVPAVALDPAGNRLGRGKGFYDRLLRGLRATTIGVAFDCQLIPDGLPIDPHDVPLDLVITPSQNY